MRERYPDLYEFMDQLLNNHQPLSDEHFHILFNYLTNLYNGAEYTIIEPASETQRTSPVIGPRIEGQPYTNHRDKALNLFMNAILAKISETADQIQRTSPVIGPRIEGQPYANPRDEALNLIKEILAKMISAETANQIQRTSPVINRQTEIQEQNHFQPSNSNNHTQNLAEPQPEAILPELDQGTDTTLAKIFDCANLDQLCQMYAYIDENKRLENKKSLKSLIKTLILEYALTHGKETIIRHNPTEGKSALDILNEGQHNNNLFGKKTVSNKEILDCIEDKRLDAEELLHNKRQADPFLKHHYESIKIWSAKISEELPNLENSNPSNGLTM